jgi:hypothetical protein
MSLMCSQVTGVVLCNKVHKGQKFCLEDLSIAFLVRQEVSLGAIASSHIRSDLA